MSWEKVKLWVICDILGGYAFQSEQYTSNEIPLVRISNITERSIVIDYQYTITESPKYSAYEIKKGDILVALSGATTGKFGMFTYSQKAYLNQRVGLIRAKANICQGYIFNYLNLIKDDILRKAGGAAQPNISTKELANFEIPLPPLPIQEKIVAILDKADALRRKDQELLKKYDELAQAIFIDMFGNYLYEGNTTLIECVEINPKKTEIDKNNEQDVSFIPMASVGEKGKFDVSLTKKISEVYSGFTYFREGDVLFAKITPCMENGKGAIAEGLKNGIGFGSTEFHVLRPMGTLNSHFIYYFLSLDKVRKWAELNMTGSAGQKRVPTSFFSKLRIDCPPLHLQEAFTKKIELINQLKAQTNAEKSEELFQSLLQRAFKGELVR